MLIVGIHEPKIEDKLSLSNYCQKDGINTNNVYTLSSHNYQLLNKKIEGYIPEVMIFNSDGFYMPYTDKSNCNAKAFNFIDSLNSNKSYRIDSTYTLDSITKMLVNLDGIHEKTIIHDDNDFAIIIYWAKWIGKLNKSHVVKWEESALNNQKSKIQVIKVNMDFQRHWGLTKESCYELIIR